MSNTLTLSGKIPFGSSADAQTAHRMLDGMLAATVCRNYSGCHADVLQVDVESATTKIASEIASTLAKIGAMSGVVIAKDPDTGLGDATPIVAVIPIPNGMERLSLLNHALGTLRENSVYAAALSEDAMERIEDFARSQVLVDLQPSAFVRQWESDLAERAERYADMLDADAEQNNGPAMAS